NWEESLHLTGESGVGRGVILEGAGERPVVWRTPKGHRDDQPLIYLSSIPGLQLRNFVFDAQEHVKDLIMVSGPCPGVTLEDLYLTGFGQSAIVLDDCAGDSTQTVNLQRLRIVGTQTASALVRFAGRSGEGNHFVHVTDCRLEGPSRAAASFAGP